MRIKYVSAMLAMASGLALAHHAFVAEFDPNKRISLTGKLKEMKWSNPHAWFYLLVDKGGKVEEWALETNAANAIIRRGWRKEDLTPGTVLKVDGWQARNGSNTANVSSITFADGKRLFAGSSNPNDKGGEEEKGKTK